MGPFFNDIAIWLETRGREAVNVVFNGGDRFYCRHRPYLTYTRTPEEFACWLKETWRDYPFDTLLCFGDCRPLHQVAGTWAKSRGYVFWFLKRAICGHIILRLKKVVLMRTLLCHAPLGFIVVFQTFL